MITRFESIKKYRVFQDFKWPQGLDNFSRYNLIYGWNGTGKTTLSNLFRAMEKKAPILDGEFTVNIDGNRILNKTLAIEPLPPMRVFNEGFVRDNVFTVDGSVAPIFVLGEKNIETQKQVEELKLQLQRKLEELARLEKAVGIREFSLDDYCKEVGKSIKQLLSSSGQNSYNSYTKRSYIKKAEALSTDKSYSSCLLTDSEKDKLKKVIAATPKDRVALVKTKLPDLNFFSEQASRIMERTVLSQSIYELKNDPDLAQWVREGMEQHTRKQSSTCLFCGQSLPPNRLQRLEAHFNQQYTAFITEINNLIDLIQGQIEELDLIKLPDKAALNDHLSEPYQKAIVELESETTRIKSVLKELLSDLSEKKGKIFESIQSGPTVYGSYTDPISKINEIIQQHNQETGDFYSIVTDARQKLENAIVAESMDSYSTRKRDLNSAQGTLKDCQTSISSLQNSINKLEVDIVSHRRPAEELNQDLQFFLGHNALRLEAQDSGYRIMRGNEVAAELSQGEKTAVAFLYFLKSLDSKDFDHHNGIVIIDDPIASLDSNSIFHAFSYMKERIHDVGQLFVLTHNFQFFKQIKNWFRNDQLISSVSNFYMLRCTEKGGHRSSELLPLDDLLLKHDSEYHYLFSQLYKHAYKPTKNLEPLQYIPNIARRLLEAFLDSRHPAESGNFYRQLESVSKDKTMTTSIYDFLSSTLNSTKSLSLQRFHKFLWTSFV
jgi:wobble nucleotide-excising tRNase